MTKLKERNELLCTRIEELSEEKIYYYTGIPKKVCEKLLEIITRDVGESTGALNNDQQFIMTLMKLRKNFEYTHLGFAFLIHRTTASNIFHKWIDYLYCKLKVFIWWPTREQLQLNVPPSFVEAFGNKITVIIDCFEIFVERSGQPETLVQTWSHYKHHNTIKFLIGIAPYGKISFISKAYVGRASDTFIAENSGFLENLVPGDIVLADRGFHIKDAARLYKAEVIEPAFLRGRKQLDPRDVENSRKIANVRIHVERVIGHLRKSYRLLSEIVPMKFLREKDTEGITTIDKIVTICCALVNLNEKVV